MVTVEVTMRPAEWLQEVRMKRFEEAYDGWQERRLSQEEAARILGVSDRTFRRYVERYDDGGLDALHDRRISQASHRRAPVDEVLALTTRYHARHTGWSARHFHTWYQRFGGTRSSFQGIGEVIRAKGLFSSLYTDRGSHYWRTPEAGGKVDKENPTQFGRAMKQLGIEMIPAYSPEARGRSERMFGTHQNRLTKELALYGIIDIEAANRYIAQDYLPAFNEEFLQPPLEEGSAFVPWIGGNIDEILCEQYDRQVGNDNCVSFEGRKLQIPSDRHRCHYIKASVRVHRYLDYTLAIFHGPRKLAGYDDDGILIGNKGVKASA